MAYIAPQGDIYLTVQNIDRQHKNIVYDDPDNYCMTSPGGGPVLHLTAQQYTQVGEGVLRCDVTSIHGTSSDAVLNVITNYPFNYIYFKNTGSARRTGAFITSAKYVNNGLVEYNYEIDPIVTYYPYSFQSKGSQIVKSSAIAPLDVAYNLPEPFDAYLGSIKRKHYMGSLLNQPLYLTLITSTGSSPSTQQQSNKYPLEQFGQFYSAFRYQQFEPSTNGLANLRQLLSVYETNGLTDSIISLTLCPQLLNDGKAIYTTVGQFPQDIISALHWDDISAQGQVMTYEPKYRKLCRYPYHYIEIVDKATGSVHQYQIERFRDGVRFYGYASAFPQPSLTIAPYHYDALDDYGFDRGFTITLPQIPYTLSQYERWLGLNQDAINTQRTVSAVSSIASGAAGVASIVGGIAATATGAGAAVGVPMIIGGATGVAGGIGSFVQGEQSAQIQFQQAAQMPPQASTGIAHTAWSFGCGLPEIYEVCINPDILKWADISYIPRFGQTRVSMNIAISAELQQAQTDGKDNVFIQTRGFNPYKVESSFDIRDQIASIFDNGTRIWESATALAN